MSDVSVSASSTITFGQAPGAPPTVIGCVDLDIINDDDFEGDHSFNVELVGLSQVPNTLTFGTNTSVTFTITDNQGKLQK